MKKIILLFFVLILMGCQSKPMYDKEHLKIIIASDLHYFLKDYYQDCEWFEDSLLYGDGKMVTDADDIIQAFIEQIKTSKPDLVILTGDLTFNGEKGSHQKLAQLFSSLKGINIAVIPGNHDVDNIHAKGYGKDDYFEVENVNAREFQKIYENLGYQLAESKHQDSLSYRIDLNQKYSLLMMDSTAHEQTGSSLDIGGYFSESTYKWLEKQLQDIHHHKRIPLIAMHHNLVDHSELLNRGYTIMEHEKISQLFKQYQVPLVLSGHIHCQNIKETQGIYDIASSSLLDAPLQYGVLDINNHKMNYHTERLKISKNADDYFELVSRNHFLEDFTVIQDKKIRESMLNVIAKANLYYFAGNISEHILELKQMPGYDYFYKDQGKQVKFYKTYLENVMKESQSQQSLDIIIP